MRRGVLLSLKKSPPPALFKKYVILKYMLQKMNWYSSFDPNNKMVCVS